MIIILNRQMNVYCIFMKRINYICQKTLGGLDEVSLALNVEIHHSNKCLHDIKTCPNNIFIYQNGKKSQQICVLKHVGMFTCGMIFFKAFLRIIFIIYLSSQSVKPWHWGFPFTQLKAEAEGLHQQVWDHQLMFKCQPIHILYIYLTVCILQ